MQPAWYCRVLFDFIRTGTVIFMENIIIYVHARITFSMLNDYISFE